MRYSAALRTTWRHVDLPEAGRDLHALVHYATLAASSHNTQPWRFRLRPGSISILPDKARRCPVVDADDHHLYASLGCAAENLLLAARAAGLAGDASYDTAADALHIALAPAAVARTAWFEAIPERQCSRTSYDGSALSNPELRQLENAAGGVGGALLLFTETRHKDALTEYVAAGNRAQFGDARWAREMRDWIRFNSRIAVRTSDGIYGASLGIPSVPQWLGKRVMRWAVSAEGQSRTDRRHIASSSAIAIIVSGADDPAHWIEAGRRYQRLALQATVMGLRTAFLNQPVEVPALRAQLASYLALGSQRPDLILRVGRGPAGPRSLRRPLEQVIARDE